MTILITGGAGFIGSHLAERLLNEGFGVRILDNLSTGSFENLKSFRGNPNLSVRIGSVLDKLTLEEEVQNSEITFHLAAAVGVKYIVENPLKSLLINIGGTENVLEVCNQHKKRVILASTSEVYGKNENIPLKETDDRLLGGTHIHRWGYSCSKAVDEFLGLAYFREKKLPVSIVRFFNTCGPRQTGTYGMVVPKFIHSALLNQKLLVHGDGKQKRCFTYVEDVIECLFRLMKCKKSIGEIVNVGSTSLVTINELAKKTIELTNSDSTIEYVSYEQIFGKDFEDMKVRQPDVSKLKDLIDYAPETQLEQILQKTIAFFKD